MVSAINTAISMVSAIAINMPHINGEIPYQELRFISQNDTQAKCIDQSAANVPLGSTGTQGAPCRKQQAEQD